MPKKPTAEDWPELLRLLDEALQLDEQRRVGFLETLEPLRREQLRELLGQRRAIETRQFLARPAQWVQEATASVPVAQAGQRVGPWRLIREIGQGGMAWVWLAERADGQGQRRVALKLPRIDRKSVV